MSRLRAVPDVNRLPEIAGKLPPQELEAEKAILSAVLVPHDEEAEARISAALAVVGPEHYADIRSHGRIAEGIKELRAAGTPVDLVSLGSWLKTKGYLEKIGGSAYLGELAGASPDVRNLDTHVELVLEAWEKRTAIAVCHRYAAELYHDVGQWRDYKAGMRRTLGAVTAPRSELKGVTADVIGKELQDRISAALAPADDDSKRGEKAIGVRWPWEHVSTLLGLLARGRHHVLAGRSEHGKTSLAMHGALGIANMPEDQYGFREAVYVHSLDMKRDELLFRLACSAAGLDAGQVELEMAMTPHERREEGTLTAADWHELGECIKWINGLVIVVDDEPITPDELAARVVAWRTELARGAARRQSDRELYPRCRLQLVIGDHAQKAADVASGLAPNADRRDRITAVSNGWLKIAKQGFATLLLSQLSRPDRNRKSRWPIARDLDGSGALEQDAGLVAAIYAPELDGNKEARWKGVRAVCKLKGRFGGSRRSVLLIHDKGWFRARHPTEAYYEGEEE